MDELLPFVVVIVIIILAVPYALACLLYAFPFFLVWLLVPERIGADPQLNIDLSSHPPLAKLRAEKRDAENGYDEVRYSDVGIRWSDNLDRFEERSVRGRELNEQLEYWLAESDRIKSEIERIELPEWNAVWVWQKALLGLSRKQARNAAKWVGLKWAMLSFLTVWIAAELISKTYPGFISYFKFAWNPAPDLLHPGIALGAAAGWAAGVYHWFHPSPAFVAQAQAQIEEYQEAKETREQVEDEAIEQARREGCSDNVDEDYTYEAHEVESEEQDRIEPWYETLGVCSGATKDEIKTAYRTKIKQYHPDRVSGLGEKLRALAEAETQKLNAAKEQGLSLRT